MVVYISSDDRVKTEFVENTYKIDMKLRIRYVKEEDFGTYRCLSKNSLGETDGSIKLKSKSIVFSINFSHYN